MSAGLSRAMTGTAAAAVSRRHLSLVTRQTNTNNNNLLSVFSTMRIDVQSSSSSLLSSSISSTCHYSTTTPRSKLFHIGGSSGDGNGDDEGKEKKAKLTPDEMQRIIDEENEKLLEEKKVKEYKDWKPGQRKRPLIKTNSLEEFERELIPEKYINDPIWTLRDKRCGALAIKIGMMPVWDEWGVRHACTVLWMDRNIVLGHKTMDKHGYNAIQLAAGERKVKNVGKCIKGQYQHIDDLKDSPPYLVREFRVTDPSYLIPINSQLHARHFVPGQNIDATGTSKGKGFQGAMKRHNFGGMPATHGTSLSHRALGSTGQCQDPGKVFKGKKMAGRMGNDRKTIQNLRIVKIDRGRDLLYVKGAIPGQNGGFIEIRDAIKKPLWRTDKVIDELRRPPLPTFDYESTIDGTGKSNYEEFMPLEKDDPLDPDYMDSTIVIKSDE